ncbi:MAG: M23 family metallopeptidase [Streptomycetaceae bacterium]|nr:MAG: M23 family metallopeptidase [Streptomycetaceae bacterium]
MRRTTSLIMSAFFLLTIFTQSAQAAPTYAFPISGCTYTYARAHHNYPATDILTKKGCKFVASTSGTIDEINRVDKWSGKTNLGADRGGLFVSMIGDDGVRYYGSHLGKVAVGIEPGVRVAAGDLLGLIGTSGDARGTASHVHYGISWPTPADIWWVRRGELLPWQYLNAWKVGKDLSPAKSVAALEKKIGTVPKQVGY